MEKTKLWDHGDLTVYEAEEAWGAHLCPVCGKYKFFGSNDFDVCNVCGWQNDGYQEENPDEGGLSNAMSLNTAREAYGRGEEVW